MKLALQIGLVVASILSIFFFPWPLTVLLTLISGVFWPPVALAVGVLYELLYAPGTTLPWAVIIGLAATGGLFFVHQFIKTRIMSE